MDEWMKEKVIELINSKLLNEPMNENNEWMNWFEINQWLGTMYWWMNVWN